MCIRDRLYGYRSNILHVSKKTFRISCHLFIHHCNPGKRCLRVCLSGTISIRPIEACRISSQDCHAIIVTDFCNLCFNLILRCCRLFRFRTWSRAWLWFRFWLRRCTNCLLYTSFSYLQAKINIIKGYLKFFI